MGFEIIDSKENLPPEEDIYDVNDIEEQDEFNKLLGMDEFTQEARIHRRRIIIAAVAFILILAFALAFGGAQLLHLLGL